MDSRSTSICPRCNQFFVRQPHSGDFVHACQGDAVLSQEDVLVIGDWQDFTGSNTNANQALMQGQENTLTGRPQIEGNKDPGARSQRGFPKNRFRQRQHLEYFAPEFFTGDQPDQIRDPDDFDV